MAGIDTAVTTGAKPESDLRRRNIPGTSKHHVDSNRINDEDAKKARTQVR